MSSLPPWFITFCRPETDRRAHLMRVLTALKCSVRLWENGQSSHIEVFKSHRPIPEAHEPLLMAHYDRVPGSPGANDNGAAVLALVDYLIRHQGRPSLRIYFSDREELSPGDSPKNQGSYALAQNWDRNAPPIPIVFDMVGKGDTLVLGHGALSHFRKIYPEGLPVDLDRPSRLRLSARRWLSQASHGEIVEIDAPFSDDLGLLLAGFPSVQVSLLPRKEARTYQTRGIFPLAWKSMHTADDRHEDLWPESRAFMTRVLDTLDTFPWQV